MDPTRRRRPNERPGNPHSPTTHTLIHTKRSLIILIVLQFRTQSQTRRKLDSNLILLWGQLWHWLMNWNMHAGFVCHKRNVQLSVCPSLCLLVPLCKEKITITETVAKIVTISLVQHWPNPISDTVSQANFTRQQQQQQQQHRDTTWIWIYRNESIYI